MKNKKEFLSFNYGICNIISEDNEGKRVFKYMNLGFNEKFLGYGRYYKAQSVNVEVSRVIVIPKIDNIDNYDEIQIKDKLYKVELIQEDNESLPKSLILTLKKAR